MVENPSVCLYYKEVEENGCAPSALDVVVAFSPADALVMDKETAELLCNQLNKDKVCPVAGTDFTVRCRFRSIINRPAGCRYCRTDYEGRKQCSAAYAA